MNDNEQIMIVKGRMKIAATHFPHRKKIVLGIYDYHNNIWVKAATFSNNECAEDFMDYLATFVGARKDEVTE